MSCKCVNASMVECTCRGRQPGDPSGEAALAPLKGLAAVAIYGVQMLNAELELAARTGCLRGFLAQFTNKPLRFR